MVLKLRASIFFHHKVVWCTIGPNFISKIHEIDVIILRQILCDCSLERRGESHYSHMYSSTLHDPIFPHVQFHWEYALGCIATCTVPATMHDPIFPHVQFQQEYELASHGSCAVDSLSWGGTESWFFLCSLHTAYIHTIELNRGTYPHTLLGKKYQHSF